MPVNTSPTAFHPEQLLDALDPEQRAVAEALRGPVRVLAGAGTGKTRAITHRIAHGVASGIYAPSEVLAVSFTVRASGEMRVRLAALGAGGVQARTFHSAALRQLRYFWPRAYQRELPQLIESKIGLLATAARRQRLTADQALLRDLASEIEWAKVSNVSPDDYSSVAPARGRTVGEHPAELVAGVYASYEETKRDQNRMDMEDVLLFTAGLLASDERIAATVRSQYKWFVVDEFQDVSPLQSALLDLWLGGRDELCVVGDPAQTIYSFAGAQARFLLDFPQRYPGTTSIELVRNYRSTPQVVATANAVLGAGATGGVRLQAQRPAGPACEFVPYSDEPAEADGAAQRISKLIAGGTSPGEIAILFRINAQSEAFEEALSARGIPYVVRGAARFFDRPEVRQGVTLLRAAARTGAEQEGLVDSVRATLSQMGWSDQPPTGRGQSRDRWESLQALVDLAGLEPTQSLTEFVADLDRRTAEQHAPVADGVTLATLHAAKGLEWDAVFLIGMVDGTLPIIHARTPDEVEEERRLLYVGVTRAREHLTISWAAARNPGGRGSRQPSRFLESLLPGGSSSGGAKATPTKRSRRAVNCRECGKPLMSGAEKKTGRCSGCPASYDEALYEQLRGWRSTRAQTDSVPAYVVFTDATLQLIAEHRPTSDEGLLRIAGVGPAKLEKYGAELMEVLTEN